MARGVRGGPGGILGLLTEAYRHEPALRSTLIAAGCPLGDADVADMDWRDLRALLQWPPEGSALARDLGIWSPLEHMEAAHLHASQSAVWQAGGGRGRRPRRVDLDSVHRERSGQRPYGRGSSVPVLLERLGLTSDDEEG